MIFKFSDDAFLLQIEPLELMFPEAVSDMDKNMISTKITVKTTAFSGEYKAELMTVDFEKFKQELKLLYQNLEGQANFACLERYLSINVKGDGIGHFTAECIANDKPWLDDNELRFKFCFDQQGFCQRENKQIPA